MKFHFRKRKDRRQEQAGTDSVNDWRQSLAQYIGERLRQATQGFSPTRWRMICVAFVLLAGGGSVWVLVSSVRHPGKNLGIQPITYPARALPSPLEPAVTDPDVLRALARIKVFLRQVDSLRNDPAGRAWADSLFRARPGLFDSIQRVERLYQP